MVAFRRVISCWARPRLFTSSMLRSDSVVDPRGGRLRDDHLLDHFDLRLNTELRCRRTGTVAKNTGVITMHVECVDDTNTIPTSDVNTTLIDAEITARRQSVLSATCERFRRFR